MTDVEENNNNNNTEEDKKFLNKSKLTVSKKISSRILLTPRSLSKRSMNEDEMRENLGSSSKSTSDNDDGIKSNEDTPLASPRKSALKKSSSFLSSSRKGSMSMHQSPPKAELIKETFMSQEQFDEKFPHSTVALDFHKFPSQRNHIAYEILTSEDTYVKSLEIALALYKEPVEKGEATYPKLKALSQTFSAMKDILNVNTMLLDQLKERFRNWSENQQIGDIVLSLAPFMKMYTQYTENYENVSLVVRKARKKDKYFSSVCDLAQSHALAGAAKIESFLILPVQRVPRYVLLLTDLIKNTPATHPDYPKLTESLGKIKDVADYINNASKAYENREKCIEIEKLFGQTANFVEAHRKFVHQGNIVKQCRKDRQPRGLFLFSDIIVYGHPLAGGKYGTPGQMELLSVSIQDVPDSAETDTFNAFVIKGEGKSFKVYADSPETKKFWLEKISTTISENKESAKVRREATVGVTVDDETSSDDDHAPVWTPDSEVPSCNLCGTKFTLVFRRHHCRKCGSCICRDCSKRKMLVPAVKKTKPVRVCDACYKTRDLPSSDSSPQQTQQSQSNAEDRRTIVKET